MKTTLIQSFGVFIGFGLGGGFEQNCSSRNYANIPVFLDMKDVGPKDLHDAKII